MEKQELLLETARGFRYTSFLYLDEEDVLVEDASLLLQEPEFIAVCQPQGGKCNVHWAAQTGEAFLSGMKNVLQRLAGQSNGADEVYIEFVPAEFVAELEGLGFAVQSHFVDFWLSELQNAPLAQQSAHTVRAIQPGEYQAAASITRRCSGLSRGFTGENDQWTEEWALSEHTDILVAETPSGSGIAGIVYVRVYGFESDKGPILWVREVAVDPDFQRRGIGRALVGQALCWGKDRGAARSFLAADLQNDGAITLYEQFGFRRKEDQGQINMSAALR